MRILFTTAAPALPQLLGGSQRTSDALIRALIARGHTVGLACGLLGGDMLGLRGRVIVKFSNRLTARDQKLGYTAWRSWFPWQTLKEVAAEFRPDAGVVLAGSPAYMMEAFEALNLPALMAFQNVEYDDVGGDISAFHTANAVANSRFTSNSHFERFGVKSIVIHPFIERDKYIVESSGDYVTFINPHPVKGLDVALKIAELLPNTKFLFVKAWKMSAEEEAALQSKLAKLPNVKLHAPVSDMRIIYRQTRLLLVPSQWEEGYGRVATEAQFSGIPVIGSDRGGLPEAIGPGGVVLPYKADPQIWADSVHDLYSDDRRYQDTSKLAVDYASRIGVTLSHQIDRWEKAIQCTADGRGWDQMLAAEE